MTTNVSWLWCFKTGLSWVFQRAGGQGSGGIFLKASYQIFPKSLESQLFPLTQHPWESIWMGHIFFQSQLLSDQGKICNGVYWVLLYINNRWFMRETDIKMIFRKANEPHTNKKLKALMQITPKDRYFPIRTIYPESINREGHNYPSVC